LRGANAIDFYNNKSLVRSTIRLLFDFGADHSIQAIDLKIEITTAGSSSDSFGTLNRRLSANPQ